jgi:aromatic ring-opening dioxygenase catalytic subunit (LigB family)
MPVIFVPHGGGPWPFMQNPIGRPTELQALSAYLSAVRDLPPTPPKALLIVSAHWEAPMPTVMTSAAPPLLYDYYGFPPETYKLSWPAPGAPDLAQRVRTLLSAAGIASAEDATRGFDHGVFVPLSLPYPEPVIPTLQLSLKSGLDPSEHLAIGRALAPLRDEGVFIIGSGLTYHNLSAIKNPASAPAAAAFDVWLRETLVLDPEARDENLTHWARAPMARQAHPREEHLLPLMVAAGAAGSTRGSVAYRGTLLGLDISGYAFG